MMLPYEYPVVYFYSEDPEDSEVIQKQGQIEPIRLETEPYEAVVSAEGYSFHILFGSQCNGNFLCIPDWHTGCELDIFFRFCPVQMWQHTVDVYSLPHSIIAFETQLIFPQFCLSYKYQCHRAFGIKTVVQQETEFLNGLFFQQMCLIQQMYLIHCS